jgi:hypothetical protein
VRTDASGNFVIPETLAARSFARDGQPLISKRSYSVDVFKKGYVLSDEEDAIRRGSDAWPGRRASVTESASDDHVDLGTIQMTLTNLDPANIRIYEGGLVRQSTCRGRLATKMPSPAWTQLVANLAAPPSL